MLVSSGPGYSWSLVASLCFWTVSLKNNALEGHADHSIWHECFTFVHYDITGRQNVTLDGLSKCLFLRCHVDFHGIELYRELLDFCTIYTGMPGIRRHSGSFKYIDLSYLQCVDFKKCVNIVETIKCTMKLRS